MSKISQFFMYFISYEQIYSICLVKFRIFSTVFLSEDLLY
jgi:hypothetical protein